MQGGEYFLVDMVCTPNPCDDPGACCTGANGLTCQESTASACVAQGGRFLAEIDQCDVPGLANPCGGACCTGGCDVEFTAPDDCPGTYMGDGVSNFPNPCCGACCADDGSSCTDVPRASDCLGGIFQEDLLCGDSAACAGACCEDDSCLFIAPDFCMGGFQGVGKLCTDETIDCPACPAPGACDIPHDNAGCEDADCCAVVCGIDPFCCNAFFDETCVEIALVNCGGGGECDGDLNGDMKVDLLDFALASSTGGDAFLAVAENWLNLCP